MKQKFLSILLAFCLLLGCVPALALPAAAAEPEGQPSQSLHFGRTIALGRLCVMAIKEDGTLWTWGHNNDGMMGVELSGDEVLSTELGDMVYTSTPVQVPIDKPVVSVDVSDHFTSAITYDGELWNWGGKNSYGYLGRETDHSAPAAPGKVMGNVQATSCGINHAAALTKDGTVWTWGGNSHGQLGKGVLGSEGSDLYHGVTYNYNYEILPIRVLDNAVFVEAGGNSTFAILNDGSLWGWGDNSDGMMGNDRSTFKLGEHDDSVWGEEDSSTQVREPGVYSEYVRPNGGVIRLISDGGTYTRTYYVHTSPIKIMDDVKKVSNGSSRSAILKNDGTLWTTGSYHVAPDVDDGDWRRSYTYAPVQIMDGVADVEMYTRNFIFAVLKEDGTLWTWGGYNSYGELGWGTDENGKPAAGDNEPTMVLDDVVEIAVGEGNIAALRSDGSLWMSGANAMGQLAGATDEAQSNVFIKVMDGVALPGKTSTFEPAEGFDMPGSASDSMPGAPASWMKIPQDAGYFGGNAYALYAGTNCTWSQAEAYCEQQGGHLAVISTEEELEYVRRINADFYLGSYVDNEGYYRWVTGENWYCKAWAPGEPWSGNCLVMRGGLWYGANSDQSPGYFLCEWEGGSTYTIYFDANGGTVNAASKQVYNGYPCGPLPIAVRKGYSFQGWYTDDGRLATANSPVETTVDFTLHARWAVNTGGPTVNDVTYSFGNNAYDLDYEEGEKIPWERFVYMYGNNNASWTAYEREEEWGGSCFGMSASATFLYMSNNAVPPSQLSLTDGNSEYTVKQLIEAMHIIQCSSVYQRARGKNDNNYVSLATAVWNFQNTNTEPVFISFWGPRDSEGKRPGHAVLGLGLYRDAVNRRDVIQIYDPNFPGDANRYIDLYWSTPGEYTGWYYCVNDEENWGSGYDGGRITYATYSDVMTVWNNRGSETILTANTMSVNCANATIYDYAGNAVATIRDGQVTSNRSDIFQVSDPIDAGTDRNENEGVALWVPSEYFTVVNEDSDGEALSVQVSGQNATVSVTTSSDRVLVYANADDETNVALVNGKDETYEMVFNSAGGGEVRLTGTTKEGVPACFAQIAGELSGMGLGVGNSSRLSIDGEEGSADDVAQTTVLSVVTSTAPSNVSAIFADVPGGNYYSPAVQWAYENGITVGTSLNQFSPAHTCTRAEALTLLWRALGCPTAAASVQPFADVQESDYFYQAALWAAGTGVSVGVDENRFAPERTCSDWEFLTFLWRALGKPGQRTEFAGYDDAAAWAEELGLLLDTDTQPPCLRRDAVTFLYRALA